MKNVIKNLKCFCFTVVLLLGFSSSNRAFAQILNLEKYRVDGDSLKNYAMNFNGSLTLNNRSAAEDNPVDLFGYNFSLHAVYTPKKHSYIFIGHRNFLRINENPFLNFGYLHARINFYRKNRLNFEVFTQLSDDNFRGLNPRFLTGSALRYRILDKSDSELILGTGAFLERERWFHPQEGSRVIITLVKSTTNFVFRHKFSPTFHVNGVVFYQFGYDPSISKIRNRYSADININSKITRRLNLTNHFDFSYEDKPVVPITRFIFSFRTGVAFEL